MSPNASEEAMVGSQAPETQAAQPQGPPTKLRGANFKNYTRGLSAVYTTWVKDPALIDRFNAVNIVSVLFFRQKIDIPALRERIAAKVLPAWPRFRSIPVLQKDGRVAFEEVAEVDLEYHIREEASDPQMGQAEFDSFLSLLYNRVKDGQKPLWFFHVIQNMDDGRSAIVFEVDHALGDGISMVQLLFDILDQDPNGGKQAAVRQRMPEAVGTIPKLVAAAVGTWQALAGPLLPADPPTKLKLKDVFSPSKSRVFARANKLPLSKVKEIKNRLQGTTVNDILAGTLNLAIKRYLQDQGDPIVKTKRSLRVSFPISVRRPGNREPGNLMTTSIFKFTFDFSSRKEAVWRINRQVALIKLSPQPYIEMILIRVLSRVFPPQMLVDISLFLFGKFTMMLSNVPGPQEKCFFLGQELDELYFYLFISIGIYCGLLSYNDQVSFTIAADPNTEDQPGKLAKYWNQEFEALYEEVMREPEAVSHNKPKGMEMPSMSTLLIGSSIAAAVVGLLITRRS